jgi:Holliday junction resolvase RusA-like endonuclease
VKQLVLVVPGEPVPLERARRGKGGHFFLPPRSREFRQRVQTAWLVEGRVDLGDGPLKLSATFVCSPDRRRDVSNMVKAIEDALQDSDGGRLCFRDDAQIIEIEARRVEVGPVEEPHSEIELRAL